MYIANAEIDYGSGWNYTADFTWLARHPAATARQLAAAEVGSWNRLHAPAGADDAALRSHIALDTSRLPALARATKTLVGALASRPATVVTADRAAYVSCPPYWAQLSDGTGENSNNWTAGLLRDYGQFLEGLPADSPANVASSARAVSAALRSATIGTVDGSLRLGQSAFNITLPQARTMTSGWLDSYVAATPDWNSATGWADLLAATARVADKRPLRITATLGGSAQPTEAGPALVRVSSPGRDLGEARLTILRVASDGTFAVDYGVVSDGIANGSQIDLGWDGKLWTVGDPAQPAAASPWITLGALGKAESPPVLAVHGKIRSKGEVHEADLLFVPGEQRADTFVVISDGRATSMTTAEIHASASKAVFVPSVDSLVLDSGKILTVAGRPLPIPAAGISISEMKAPPGDYALYAEAEDTWGNDGADLTTMVKVR